MIARAVTTPISLITVRLQSQSTSAKTISGHVREKQPSDTDDGSGSDEENDENTVAQICHDIYSEQGWTGSVIFPTRERLALIGIQILERLQVKHCVDPAAQLELVHLFASQNRPSSKIEERTSSYAGHFSHISIRRCLRFSSNLYVQPFADCFTIISCVAVADPLMLSKTRLQSRSKGKRQYKSTTAFFTQIYQRYGVSGLYVGLYGRSTLL